MQRWQNRLWRGCNSISYVKYVISQVVDVINYVVCVIHHVVRVIHHVVCVILSSTQDLVSFGIKIPARGRDDARLSSRDDTVQ